MVLRDVYSQPNASDPVLDADFVLKLVRRHTSSADAVTGVDESGGEARVYAIDDGVILKTQRPHRLRPRTSLAKEACFLRHLESEGGVSVPEVLGYGRDGDVEYLCMTRMAGVAMLHADLTEAARADALRQLGRMLRRIYEVRQEPLIQSGLFPTDGSQTDLRTRFKGALDRSADLIRDRPEEWPLGMSPEDVARAALQSLPPSKEFVALHSNPGPEHAFVDPRSGAFSGLIDFGDAFISHPALDLRRWRAVSDRSALLEGYRSEGNVDPAFLAVWRVGLIEAEMTAIARGREDPSAAEQNLKELIGEL